MQLSDFFYHLPRRLIARYPREKRTDSRLLCLDAATGQIRHKHFHQLPELLRPGDLLVFNNTRVIPARLLGHKSTGGRVEVLVERLLDNGQFLAQLKAGKPTRAGAVIHFDAPANSNQAAKDEGKVQVTVLGREQEFYRLQLDASESLLDVLDRIGHIPLPPYIKREDQALDRERYQTVYATAPGAVAAPTAGLHFDQAMLEKLPANGVNLTFVTLHVGAGTFQPIRVQDVVSHKMHEEYTEVSSEVWEAIRKCKAARGRVIAVGTTAVRSLESAALRSQAESFRGDTDIFIYPGFRFQVVDAMITNFHLPESTLLMLVSAFADRQMVLDAYAEAIELDYRFFSYGDAMFIHYGA